MDERYLIHRLKATRFAAIVCAILMGTWMCYEFYVRKIFRPDLIVIVGAMAAAKLGAMIYYRRTN
jgi:hypothetical protein